MAFTTRRALAAEVHWPHRTLPRKLPPQGLGGITNICKPTSRSPPLPVSLCPQAGSAPPPSMYTQLWMSCGPCVWTPVSGGGRRLRVHLAGPCPSSGVDAFVFVPLHPL